MTFEVEIENSKAIAGSKDFFSANAVEKTEIKKFKTRSAKKFREILEDLIDAPSAETDMSETEKLFSAAGVTEEKLEEIKNALNARFALAVRVEKDVSKIDFEKLIDEKGTAFFEYDLPKSLAEIEPDDDFSRGEKIVSAKLRIEARA